MTSVILSEAKNLADRSKNKEEPMNEQDEPIKPQLTKDFDVVNLNTATAEELSRLPGIGAKLAKRIVAYRTKVHPFREPAEINQVRGVSAALYAGIADLLTVGPAEPVPWVALSAADPGLAVEPEEAALPVEPEEPALPIEAEEAALRVEPEVPALPAEPEEPMLIVEPEAPEQMVEPEAAASVVEPEVPAAASRQMPPAQPPSAPPPRPQPAAEPKRGAGWLAFLAVGLLSAIAGACLALLLLQAMNGTLRFGSDAAVSELEARARQLDGQAGELVANLSQVQARLDEVDSRLAAAQAELKAVNQEMARMGGDVEAFQGRLRAIEAQFGGLTEDLQAVRQATRRFDAFLSGLRELLDQAQGPALGVTPLPSRTQSPQAPTPTRRPGLTVVPQPTPTPRP